MDTLRRMPRATWAALVALGLVVTTAVVVFAWKPAPRHTVPLSAPTTTSTQAAIPSQPTPTQPSSAAMDTLSQDLHGLREVHLVDVVTPPPVITGVVATQPDLYAGEFVRRLLTQQYDSPRADLLAWVQAESAQTSEPLVVGLVPSELRDRMAVYSVTYASTGAASPIPSAAEWEALGQKDSSTTVQVERVREPVPWANAVQAGRITDPGCTAREVVATITRHQGDSVEKTSVSLSLVLEGPPSRATWGFVKLVQFTAIPMGAS